MNIQINNLQKAECFAAIFQHIRLFTDNINIMFEQDRMYLQTMDSARVCILEIVLPSTWFDEYTHNNEGNLTLGMNSSLLYKILSSRDKSQTIQIVSDGENDDKLIFHFTSATKSVFDKHFELPLIDLDEETMMIPAFEYQAEFSLPSAHFAAIVNQLKQFGDTMDVSCSEDNIILKANTPESGKMSVEIKIDDLTSFVIDEGGQLDLSFSLTYLHNFCLYHKLSTNMDVKMSTNFPMQVHYPLDEDAGITFYLAPKMSDD